MEADSTHMNPVRKPEVFTGALALVVTAFLWSTAGLLIKLIPWHPFAIAGGRSLIASVVILLILKRPVLHLSFPQVAAAIANSMTMLLFVAANKYTTSANAILLQYLCPVTTALLGAVLLKEKVRWQHITAIVMVAAGMSILFMDRLGGGLLLGNMLALASALSFSLFIIFMRMQKDGSPLESILLSHWLTAVIGIGISCVLPLPVISMVSISAILALGIFQVGLAAAFFSYGIKRISAINANLIAVIEPVFNPLWVFIAVGEKPSLNTVIGGALIIAAVTGASVISARRRQRN
ncbi:MAG: EamA family transporter [Spirochaetes bacterium]|nr:EamA family transporter [Spirochaetota bacterium]